MSNLLAYWRNIWVGFDDLPMPRNCLLLWARHKKAFALCFPNEKTLSIRDDE